MLFNLCLLKAGLYSLGGGRGMGRRLGREGGEIRAGAEGGGAGDVASQLGLWKKSPGWIAALPPVEA